MAGVEPRPAAAGGANDCTAVPDWAAPGNGLQCPPEPVKAYHPLQSFTEALAGNGGTARPRQVRDFRKVAKPYRNSGALTVCRHMAVVLAKRLKTQMGKPTAKDLALVGQIVADVGEESAMGMVDCLVMDWTAIRQRWNLRDEVPSVVALWLKRQDLAAAVASGEGVTHGLHRVSGWAASRNGGTVRTSEDIWK